MSGSLAGAIPHATTIVIFLTKANEDGQQHPQGCGVEAGFGRKAPTGSEGLTFEKVDLRRARTELSLARSTAG